MVKASVRRHADLKSLVVYVLFMQSLFHKKQWRGNSRKIWQRGCNTRNSTQIIPKPLSYPVYLQPGGKRRRNLVHLDPPATRRNTGAILPNVFQCRYRKALIQVSVMIWERRKNDHCNGCAHWTIDVDSLVESTELGWLFRSDECVHVLDPVAEILHSGLLVSGL